MGRWIKDFQTLIWAATLALVSLVWVYQTFATMTYVDQKHQGVMEILSEIRDHVKTIDERTFELAQKKR